MSEIIHPKGYKIIEVSDKIAIFTEGTCEVSYFVGPDELGKEAECSHATQHCF